MLDGAGPHSVAPPSDAVRREMARLELEAIKAELEARAGEVVPDVSPPDDVPTGEAAPDGEGQSPA